MANIHDVAKRAGVSKSTVSLVLNHSPLVKEDTRELVEAAIAQKAAEEQKEAEDKAAS